MSDHEYIERKEFHDTLDDLKSKIKNDRQGLRDDIQSMQQTLNNGVKSRAQDNREDIKEIREKVNEINSKLDRAQGGFSGLKIAGMMLATTIASVGSVVGIFKALGALAHWT